MKINYKKLFVRDENLRRAQDEVGLAFDQLNREAFIQGTFLAGVELTGGNVDNIVTHGLGFTPKGFIIMAKSAASDVYSSPTVNPRPELTIIVRATNACTVTMWVF